MIKRLYALIYKPVAPVVILVIALYTLIWGLWLLSPFWEVFTQADLYSALSSIAGEWFWGSLAAASGIFSMLGLREHWPEICAAASWVMTIHWLLVGGLYFMGDWQNTGGITAIFLAVLSAIVFLNVRQTMVRPHLNRKNLH